VISIRTTEYNSASGAERAFETNMFSRTNAFALFGDEGRIKVETAAFRSTGLRVSRVRSTGHFVDLDEDAAMTFLLPSSGQLRLRVAAAEYRIAAKTVCILGPNKRRTRAEASPNTGLFHANALMIPQRRLNELMQAVHQVEVRLQDALPVAARLGEARRLSELLTYITRQFDDDLPLSEKAGAAMAVLLEEVLCDLIARSTEGLTDKRALPAAWLRVRMAEEFMRVRSDEPLSMAEVAQEVGVGLRSLQLAFLEVRAMGPRDVLLRMRLDRARERLLAAKPADTVTSIALDCGFAHLGRFPAAYRIAFGELPTETLARGRRRMN
jgi:AraC-like DNA-binding protein